MTIHGFKVTLVAAMTVAACMFLTVPTATAAEGAFKLEGAWVAKVVGIPAQWSYVLVPDSSGRYAALEGSLDIGFSLGPLFPPSDKTSLLMANLVMTGPKTGKFNSVWYGIRSLPSPSPVAGEVLWIGTSTGTFTVVAPGKIEALHNFAFYAPSADGDGDGFPDPDAVPVYMTQLSTVDTRLPLPE
jgi:hypothetical protein